MDAKMKALIAIGASITAHCQPCLAFHVAHARELGIDVTDIRDAIAMGHKVEEGSMAAMRKFSTKLAESQSGDKSG
jgi:AhpD family alkylhydroperoxidase